MGLRAAKLHSNTPCISLHGTNGRVRVPGALSLVTAVLVWVAFAPPFKALASPQLTFLRAAAGLHGQVEQVLRHHQGRRGAKAARWRVSSAHASFCDSLRTPACAPLRAAIRAATTPAASRRARHFAARSAYSGVLVLDLAPVPQASCALVAGCCQLYRSLCGGWDDKRGCNFSLLTVSQMTHHSSTQRQRDSVITFCLSMRVRRHGTLKRSAAARKTSACASTLLCDGLV